MNGETPIGQNGKHPLRDRTISILIGIVLLCVMGILAVVYSHDEEKPDSPHALVAAGMNQALSTLGIQEWKPGMGKQPLLYHPAAADVMVWHPLPSNRNLIPAAGPG